MDEDAELMQGIRESYEWLLEWLEDVVSDKTHAERMSGQMRLNAQMVDRAQQAPAVAGAAAVGAATTAAMFLAVIADNSPALAEQLVQQMREQIDNAGTSHVTDTVNRHLP